MQKVNLKIEREVLNYFNTAIDSQPDYGFKIAVVKLKSEQKGVMDSWNMTMIAKSQLDDIMVSESYNHEDCFFDTGYTEIFVDPPFLSNELEGKCVGIQGDDIVFYSPIKGDRL